MSVTALGRAVNLSQSALSQHLAKLRAQRVVTTRRESQALFYRIADGRIRQLLSAFTASIPRPLIAQSLCYLPRILNGRVATCAR